MKLLLVDGSALLHRAYHAYPPLTSTTGEVVGAVYGVTSMLYSALIEVNPTHVMVAWDLPRPTFRHEMYVGYKAQRPKADREMVEQIPIVKAVIRAMQVVQLEEEGFEADDIIGTLSQMKSSDLDVVILTGDQDTMQLVDENVVILTPPKGKIPAKTYSVEDVIEKYGVRPDQIVDYKALIGDVSDNIPGVAGVGPKTAASLLQTYGSLDEIFEKVSEIEEKYGAVLAKKLVEGKESAYLSKELSKIITNMKIPINLETMEYKDIKKDELKKLLEQLGFKSLIRRVWGSEGGDNAGRKKLNTNQMGLF